MGLGKTIAGAGADLPRPAGGPGKPAVPHRRADERRAELGGRVRAVRSRPEGGDDHGHAGPERRRPRRAHRGRRRRGHLVHAAAAGLRCLRGGAMVRPDPGRGPVHQEPPVEDLPVRAAAARPVQARHHRHPDGEQPDGAVVAAVDHGTRAVPEPGAVPRLLRPADRKAGRRRAARPAAAADQAAGQAPHQGAGGGRPAGEAGAGPRGRAAPAAPQALPDVPAAGAAEGPRADRRPQRQPVHDPDAR